MKFKIKKKCAMCNNEFTVKNTDTRKNCSIVCSRKYKDKTQKEYKQTEKYKEYQKEYHQSEKWKAYQQTEKYKESQKKYSQSEKCKTYQKEYNTKRRSALIL